MRIFLIMFAFSLASLGCSSSHTSGEGDIVEANGTVQYIEVEGGFYGIVADDGTQYDPMNLDGSFKEDGLRVHFRARTAEGVASIRMWGIIVELISIERI